MIRFDEINNISNKVGVRQGQIEKDYMISWLLWGIYGHDQLNKLLIFKGGTCIKKMHIEDYRFSEDMDFTLNPEKESEVIDDEVYSMFNEVFEQIKNEANISFEIDIDSKGVHTESGSAHFQIKYVGPLGGNGNQIKIDLTKGEKIVTGILKKLPFQTYSDLNDNQVEVSHYSLNEVLIEKMAALMDRTVPRDLYDFDYLTNQYGMKLIDVHFYFIEKANHKGHDPNKFIEKVEKKEATFKRQWNQNLIHQVKEIDEFEDVWREIKKKFREYEKLIGT